VRSTNDVAPFYECPVTPSLRSKHSPSIHIFLYCVNIQFYMSQDTRCLHSGLSRHRNKVAPQFQNTYNNFPFLLNISLIKSLHSLGLLSWLGIMVNASSRCQNSREARTHFNTKSSYSWENTVTSYVPGDTTMLGALKFRTFSVFLIALLVYVQVKLRLVAG
jgi:hypothetical protein